MALKFFIFCIILSPFLLTDHNIVDKIKIKSDILVAKVSFVNSVLYDINTNNVDKIVDAKEAYIYEKKDELYDVRVILRNANNNSDTISAKYMKKENELYNFQNNVILKRDKDLELKTESLQYDIKNGIATNNVDFILRYRNSIFGGKNLYLSKNDYMLSGDNVHFRINSKDL
jgi:hypothetical protein